MKLHPRHIQRESAKRELAGFLVDLELKHHLTALERRQIVADWLSWDLIRAVSRQRVKKPRNVENNS